MLTVAYDGTAYAGWQVQPGVLTVQECVESAVRQVTGESRRVLCAGRTDSGVHALGQVAAFRTDSRIPAPQFQAALQSALPRSRDIVILHSRDVHPDFHATFSAIRKTYRYLLFDGDVLPPFLQRFVSVSRSRLDVHAMQEAARELIGTHDFRCFESHFPNKATSVRTIENAVVRRTSVWQPWSDRLLAESRPDQEPEDVPGGDPAGARPVIVFEFTADGFLYNMVRAIVGTLREIGTSRHPPEHIRTVLASQDRAAAGPTAAPTGLFLVRVEYPADLMTPPVTDSGC